ncbi:serine hydrolase [uncultured Nitratireductor sp.]|uniref:serine hydrolase domain-containing protein n=1 Tax=uncultured Nitratireductor sp. TaxID=520953 RepID=UPI0025F471A2|nr:serine hydrolase domain-containing protein [uncultured Nitratireductor sp.]
MNLSSFIDDLCAEWNGERSPGVIVAVARGDEDIHRGAYGMADLAHGCPLTFRSVLRIASQSKQFTTLLTLMLETEGRLSLDDDIHDYLDYLPDYGTRITLRHLATNTSGLRDILDRMIIGGTPITAPSSRNFARRVASRSAQLNFAPGEDLLYSNTNFLFLTEILEAVSGRSFEALLAERITGPLGMSDTRLMVRDDEILPRLAAHHRRGPDGNWLRSAWGIAIGGEGGLVSTADDMLRWLRHLSRPTICDPALIERMERSGATINGTRSPYGIGLIANRICGHPSVGHGGWIAGSRSLSVRFPEADLSMAILSNHDDFSPLDLMEKIAVHILGDARKMPAARPQELPNGVYRQADGDEIFIVEAGADGQVLTTGMGSAPLAETEDGRFEPQSALPPFRLSMGEGGIIKAERFGRTLSFRRADPGVEDPPTMRADAAYACKTEGLWATLNLSGEEWQLRLESRDGASLLKLKRISGDLYTAHPVDDAIHDQWRFAPWVLPWLFTVRVSDGALVINSDRTKNLTLPAC